MKLLSRSEEIVLLSVWKLQGDAYGVTIRENVIQATDCKWSIGAIYAPLHRLVKKGFVRTRKSDPVPERGGRSRIYYEVTPKGRLALLKIKSVHEKLWKKIPALGFDEK